MDKLVESFQGRRCSRKKAVLGFKAGKSFSLSPGCFFGSDSVWTNVDQEAMFLSVDAWRCLFFGDPFMYHLTNRCFSHNHTATLGHTATCTSRPRTFSSRPEFFWVIGEVIRGSHHQNLSEQGPRWVNVRTLLPFSTQSPNERSSRCGTWLPSSAWFGQQNSLGAKDDLYTLGEMGFL